MMVVPFITKSEFDALKSSFQAQIDSYNQSIDNKIDGAIASYLVKIKLSTKQVLESYYKNYHISGIVQKPNGLRWTSKTDKYIGSL